jgi:hypothetical protein
MEMYRSVEIQLNSSWPWHKEEASGQLQASAALFILKASSTYWIEAWVATLISFNAVE